MSRFNILFASILMLNVIFCNPLDEIVVTRQISREKRFVNPSLTFGTFPITSASKMRTKRDYDECEKLRLCKLHASSQRNFFSAFQLYFVNKENARLWDRQPRTFQECEKRFGGCYSR